MLKSLITISAVLLFSGVAFANELGTDLLKKVDGAIALTEASRNAHCSHQTDTKVHEACERAYDMIVARQESYKSQLGFMLAITKIDDHSQLKKGLSAIRPAEAYNNEVIETTRWIAMVETEFKADRQIAGK